MTGTTGAPATTSGTSTREAREMDPSLETFDLRAEIEALRAEPAWVSHGRAGKTLAKTDTHRLVVSLVRAGGDVGDDDTRGPLSIHVLEGSVVASRGTDSQRVPAGTVAWLAPGAGWNARAETDAVLLLGIGWPEEHGTGREPA